MPIIASESTRTRNPIPAGQYAAVCARIIDLGDQYSEMYGKTNRKVMICWEVPEDTIEIDGKPMPKMISKEYTLALGQKSALRPCLESWRGRPFTKEELVAFDLGNVLGAPCLMQIIHNDAGYERISSIMKLPKGMQKPEPSTDLIYFDFDAKDALLLYDKLPEWIRDKIKASPQYAEIINLRANSDSADGFVEVEDSGDLPF